MPYPGQAFYDQLDRDQLLQYQTSPVQRQQGQAGFQQVDPQGNTFQQVDPAGVQPQVNPLSFLKKFGSMLLKGGKDFINAPIIGPTITKDQHDKYLETGDRGVQNWHPH